MIDISVDRWKHGWVRLDNIAVPLFTNSEAETRALSRFGARRKPFHVSCWESFENWAEMAPSPQPYLRLCDNSDKVLYEQYRSLYNIEVWLPAGGFLTLFFTPLQSGMDMENFTFV